MKKLFIILLVILMYAVPSYSGDDWLKSGGWTQVNGIIDLNNDLSINGDLTVNGDANIGDSGNLTMTPTPLASGITGSEIEICCGDLVDTNGTNWAGINGTRSMLFYGNKYRMRMNATVNKIKIYIGTIQTSIQFRFWRETTANNFILVGSSEAFTSISSSAINTFTLTSTVDVQQGDYMSVEIVCTSGCQAFKYQTETNHDQRRTDSAVTASPTAWRSLTKSADIGIPFAVITTDTPAPQVVFVGDSIIAGHDANRSYLQNSAVDPEASGNGVAIDLLPDNTINIPFHFNALTGYTTMNMGHGSQVINTINARFNTGCSGSLGACAIDEKPRLIVVNGGYNDAITTPPTFIEGGSTFLADWKSLLDAADTASVPVVVMSVTHGTTTTVAQDRKIDQYNKVLIDLVANYDNAVFVDVRPYLQATTIAEKPQATGDDGNLWEVSDTTPDYTAGVAHYTSAGYLQIAQAIVDGMNSFRFEDDGGTLPVLIVNEGGEGVGAGTFPLGSISQAGTPRNTLGYGLTVKGKVSSDGIQAHGVIETAPLDYSATRKYATMPLKHWGFCRTMADNEIIELPTPATASIGMGHLIAWTDEGDWINAMIPQTGIPVVQNDGTDNHMIGDWEVQAAVGNCTDGATNVCLYEETTSSAPAIKNLAGEDRTVCVQYWFN